MESVGEREREREGERGRERERGERSTGGGYWLVFAGALLVQTTNFGGGLRGGQYR